MILGASAIASDWPSRDLTVRFWPSSFSTVPRTRTGAGAGGVWASAGTTNRLMIATAIAVLRMVDPPLSVLLQQVTQKWRGTLVFSAHISVSAEWRPGRASAKVHGNIVALSRATLVRGKIFGPPVPSEAYFSRCFHRADLPGPAVMRKPVFIGRRGGEASSQCALNPLRSTDLSTASASASKSAAHCRSCSRDS